MLHVPRRDSEDHAAVLLTNDDCCICLEPLRPGSETVTTLQCGHAYHSDCVSGWEQKLQGTHHRARCAICQLEYGPPPPPPPPTPPPPPLNNEVRIRVSGDGGFGTDAAGCRARDLMLGTAFTSGTMIIIVVVLRACFAPPGS